jgi:hypothetical protein
MQFDGFGWDEGNELKCRKHGVSREELESLFERPVRVGPDVLHSAAERRFRALGRTATGRAVFLVFTWRVRDGIRLLRPISARYMHAKEVAKLAREIP